MQGAKILYFIDGNCASPDEISEASEIPATVLFRNARVISPGASLEKADGVAGSVPEPYQGYPTAKEAVALWSKQMRARFGRVKDEKAPKPKTKAASKTEEGSEKPSWGAKAKEAK